MVGKVGPYNEKLKSMKFWNFFTKFKYDAQRESYDNFPSLTFLRFNSGAYKNPKFFGPYLRRGSKQRYEIHK